MIMSLLLEEKQNKHLFEAEETKKKWFIMVLP